MSFFYLFFKHDLRVLKIQNATKRWDESDQVDFVFKVHKILLTFMVTHMKNAMYTMQRKS